MASPFNIFRRNQRVMMAVLTGLSMIAFIFFDATLMRNGQSNRTLFILMIAAICALGLWFVGSPRLGGTVGADISLDNRGNDPLCMAGDDCPPTGSHSNLTVQMNKANQGRRRLSRGIETGIPRTRRHHRQ